MNPQLQNKQQPESPKPAPQPQDPGPLTYFLLPDDEHDEAAAREYLERKYGVGTRDGSKRVTTIRVGRLTEKHTVICVVRRNVKEGTTKIADPESRRATTIRLDPVVGMVECEPIHVCNYWENGEHEDSDGVLNMAAFMSALGKVCLPLAPRYKPADQLLRLAFT